MSRFVREHPATSLFLLATMLGAVPLALVVVGLVPAGFDQLGALSASVAGITLAAIDGGKKSVKDLLARVLIWRVNMGWWLFVLLFPAVLTVGALYLAGALNGNGARLTGVGPLYNVVPLLLFLIVFAGLGEEFGWRGFAVPRVQVRHSALVTSLGIGILHSLWHTPLFFIEGVSQHEIAQQIGFRPAFLGYTVLVMAGAVQSTWIFNNSKGSVLLVAVYHGALNAWNGYIDIYRGQMAAIYTYTGLMALVSIAIVVVFGAEHFSRTSMRVQVQSSLTPALPRA
jgi:CAAX protease family protein